MASVGKTGVTVAESTHDEQGAAHRLASAINGAVQIAWRDAAILHEMAAPHGS
jgi:hypothetical protein